MFGKILGTRERILKNVAWAILGKIINMGGALIIGILIARYLGPSAYGLMNYIISYVTIFSILASCGLDDIDIRELSKNPKHFQYILGTSFRIRLLFSLLSFFFIVITLWIFKSDLYTTVMILAYSIILPTTCFNVIRNYFTSILQNEYIVKSEIFRTFIGVILKIILLWFKVPLWFFILSMAFDYFLITSGYIYSYRHKVGKLSEWKFDKKLSIFLLKESLPLLFSGAAVIIYQRVDQIMIKNMLDNESVGYYATAEKFLNIILFLPIVLVQTITPLLVRMKENNIALYIKKKQQFVGLVVWSSICISYIVSLLSYWIVYYTYGDSYLLAVPILQITAWKTVGTALSASSGQIIIIDRIHKWVVIRNLIGCIVCISSNLLLIPLYGVVGSAWASVLTVFSSGFLSCLFIPSFYPIFLLQIKALFCGWKYLFNIKKVVV